MNFCTFVTYSEKAHTISDVCRKANSMFNEADGTSTAEVKPPFSVVANSSFPPSAMS